MLSPVCTPCCYFSMVSGFLAVPDYLTGCCGGNHKLLQMKGSTFTKLRSLIDISLGFFEYSNENKTYKIFIHIYISSSTIKKKKEKRNNLNMLDFLSFLKKHFIIRRSFKNHLHVRYYCSLE